MAATEREITAVVFGLQTCRHFLAFSHFILQTDLKAIIWLQTSKNLTPKLMRMGIMLSTFNFTIEHILGKDNHVADCLSRLPQQNVAAISCVDVIKFEGPVTIEDIIDAQKDDKDLSRFAALKASSEINFDDDSLTQNVRLCSNSGSIALKSGGCGTKQLARLD